MTRGLSIFGVLFCVISCCGTSNRSPAQTSQIVPVLQKNWMPPRQTYPDDKVVENSCPDDMVKIEGDYCPAVKQHCMKWRGDVEGERCEEWDTVVVCVSTVYSHKRYCIDTYEYPNKIGELPQDWMSWDDVKKACESEGKRMCTRSEWTFAAEGPDRHPYPYGNGYHRDNTICNFDNHVSLIGITGDDVMNVANPKSEVAEKLRSLLVPSGARSECVSDWGVHDMSGNIDEWVVNESGKPYVSGLMGGHVFGVRNASRPMTDAHGPEFYWYETGGRCCLSIGKD